MNNFIKVIMLVLSVFVLNACTDARIASSNISKASDYFEVDRRVVFYNGITGEYMLVIRGKCSVEPLKDKLEVTCKTGDEKYKKHYLGLSDNVTYFVEQLESIGVNVYQYRVVFKPEAVIPDMEVVTSDQP
ncbi:MAG: hypothetical protein CL489_08600 [Acidobacteria bacterium]|nr:hypothetical protein [Acidobacteriota bacterium]|tara:strand:- start:38400 stop:38792 length:393 start_codon:yes stop_codon:yes gene_type:complete